jgi:hypothetical protein
VSRRQITQELQKLGITEAGARLCLPENVRPLRWQIYAVAPVVRPRVTTRTALASDASKLVCR